MTSIANFNKINELDLDSVKVKLMHHSGEGWTRDHADAVETEYRRFLFLMVEFPDEKTAPRVDVDTFWHYHILDTLKYAADCEKAFGFFLHHYPFVGIDGEDAMSEHQRAGERMRELYEQTFGCSYDAAAAYCSIVTPPGKPAKAAQATAYCSIVVPPATPAKAAQASAYCSVVVPPATPARAAQATAYCSIVVPPAKPARSTNASAYCSIHPPMRSGATAYCSIHPPVQSGATAYCSIHPPVQSIAAARGTAYCSIHPPVGGQAAGSATAYCSIHPPVSGANMKTAPALA